MLEGVVAHLTRDRGRDHVAERRSGEHWDRHDSQKTRAPSVARGMKRGVPRARVEIVDGETGLRELVFGVCFFHRWDLLIQQYGRLAEFASASTKQPLRRGRMLGIPPPPPSAEPDTWKRSCRTCVTQSGVSG